MIKVRQIVKVVLLMVQGIFEALREIEDFRQLEERVHRITQEAARELLVNALEEIDKRLLGQKDKGLKVVGNRERTLLTSIGELRIRRRLYRDEQGAYSFILDETLGIEPQRRISGRLQELAVELATEMPFRRAAKVMGYLVPEITAMGVWSEVKAAGDKAGIQAAELREAVFERGMVVEGRQVIDKLNIEADEVFVKQQRGKAKSCSIKLVVGYEGKQGPRRTLKGRHTVAGISDGPGMWEEASAVYGQKWDLSRVKRVRIGGDGASWIKKGTELFPNASYHLDPFHLRKRLTEALSFSSRAYEEVCDAIAELDRQAVVQALQQAMRPLRGARKKRVKELYGYLMDNWTGLSRLSEEERLGAIEGQVRHTIARRMKRIGARWTLKGSERMGRILAAKANDELARYVNKPKSSLGELIKLDELPIEKPACKKDDVEAWLRGPMPVLKGPFAGKLWIKYIMREIGSFQWPA